MSKDQQVRSLTEQVNQLTETNDWLEDELDSLQWALNRMKTQLDKLAQDNAKLARDNASLEKMLHQISEHMAVWKDRALLAERWWKASKRALHKSVDRVNGETAVQYWRRVSTQDLKRYNDLCILLAFEGVIAERWWKAAKSALRRRVESQLGTGNFPATR